MIRINMVIWHMPAMESRSFAHIHHVAEPHNSRGKKERNGPTQWIVSARFPRQEKKKTWQA
jgi:hypothetical protein